MIHLKDQTIWVLSVARELILPPAFQGVKSRAGKLRKQCQIRGGAELFKP